MMRSSLHHHDRLTCIRYVDIGGTGTCMYIALCMLCIITPGGITVENDLKEQ